MPLTLLAHGQCLLPPLCLLTKPQAGLQPHSAKWKSLVRTYYGKWLQSLGFCKPRCEHLFACSDRMIDDPKSISRLLPLCLGHVWQLKYFVVAVRPKVQHLYLGCTLNVSN